MEENEIIENEEINESIELTPEEEKEKLINDLTTEMLECESRLSSSASDILEYTAKISSVFLSNFRTGLP
jgi:hypothetical protein